ncbi:MAG: DJ-1/PfpI family protein [Patescibacteria group bacterium]
MPAKGKKALFIIAPENFRDEELFETQKVLEASGIKTEVASSKAGKIKGSLGGIQEIEKTLLEVNLADYGAVIFIGGIGASVYFDDAIALAIAEETFRQNKILAAICVAPSILANAGVLRGKKATSFSSRKDNLVDKGALFTGEPVTVDGKIVTASGPAAAQNFGWKVVELLQK